MMDGSKKACINSNNNTAIEQAKKKVQFSHHLEYWKEYDCKETPGQLSELKSACVKLKGRKQCDYRKVQVCNTSVKIARKEGRKTQSITEVVQAFQRRQFKEIDVLQLAKEKSQRFNGRKQTEDVLSNGSRRYLLHGVSTKLPYTNKSYAFPLNGLKLPSKSSLLKNGQGFPLSNSLGILKSSTNYPLPLVCNNRKIYDERLLPFDYKSGAHALWQRNRWQDGLPPEGKWRTPYIVQLFD